MKIRRLNLSVENDARKDLPAYKKKFVRKLVNEHGKTLKQAEDLFDIEFPTLQSFMKTFKMDGVELQQMVDKINEIIDIINGLDKSQIDKLGDMLDEL